MQIKAADDGDCYGGRVTLDMTERSTPSRVVCALGATGLLCVLAYWRALSLPLISDDYLQIQLGRDYGPFSGWAALAADPLYRCRATSILLTHWTEQLFGAGALALNWSSLALHILNTWLVLALGAWRIVGRRVAFAAACFFAIYEGHQEAVMWYAALPELLVFFFGTAALLLWLRGGAGQYAGALVCFSLALLSKESAVAVVPLLAMAAAFEGRGWKWIGTRIAPFALLAAAYFAMIFASRASHYHFHDAGTFSLAAPFWIVLPVSVGRLLWVWGALALLGLAAWRVRERATLVAAAALWIVVTLLPYSFLTYMPRVPSRHTYWASAGLALVVGAGFLELERRTRERRWVVASLASILVASQCGYIWTKKQSQLMERAAPTEELLRMAQRRPKVLRIRCFPYPVAIAESALAVEGFGDVRLAIDGDGRRPGKGAGIDLCVN